MRRSLLPSTRPLVAAVLVVAGLGGCSDGGEIVDDMPALIVTHSDRPPTEAELDEMFASCPQYPTFARTLDNVT